MKIHFQKHMKMIHSSNC